MSWGRYRQIVFRKARFAAFLAINRLKMQFCIRIYEKFDHRKWIWTSLISPGTNHCWKIIGSTQHPAKNEIDSTTRRPSVGEQDPFSRLTGLPLCWATYAHRIIAFFQTQRVISNRSAAKVSLTLPRSAITSRNARLGQLFVSVAYYEASSKQRVGSDGQALLAWGAPSILPVPPGIAPAHYVRLLSDLHYQTQHVISNRSMYKTKGVNFCGS